MAGRQGRSGETSFACDGEDFTVLNQYRDNLLWLEVLKFKFDEPLHSLHALIYTQIEVPWLA
jgi:hypothetical protein